MAEEGLGNVAVIFPKRGVFSFLLLTGIWRKEVPRALSSTYGEKILELWFKITTKHQLVLCGDLVSINLIGKIQELPLRHAPKQLASQLFY